MGFEHGPPTPMGYGPAYCHPLHFPYTFSKKYRNFCEPPVKVYLGTHVDVGSIKKTVAFITSDT